MDRRREDTPNRRELLRGCLRYTALAGLGVLSVGLLGRASDSPASSACRRPAWCRDCPALARCRRPEALVAMRESTRPTRQEGEH